MLPAWGGVPPGTPLPRLSPGVRVYDSFLRGPDVPADGDSPRAVSYHQGGPEDFLTRHHADAARAQAQGLRGLKDIAPYLLDRIGDVRTHWLAWDYLATYGGTA